MTDQLPHRHAGRDEAEEWRLPDGTLHRDDGPAVTHPDGSVFYYDHGDLHRDDGPAVVRGDGTREWYRHGRRHRDDGPAIEFPDGVHEYYDHDRLHRTDGPAVTFTDAEPGDRPIWALHNVDVTEQTVHTVTRVASATGVHVDRVARLAAALHPADCDSLDDMLLAVLT